MTQTPLFSEALKALQNTQNLFPAKFLATFSDLSKEEIEQLRQVWSSVPMKRKLSVLEDIEELAEADSLTNYEELGLFCLDDAEAEVRALGIRLLWFSEDNQLADRFIEILKTDTSPLVRSTAASALGNYVYEGELEEVPQAVLAKCVAALLDAHRSTEPLQVRRATLEALGFSSHPDVPKLIDAAYNAGVPDMKASALFAMGRSADQAYATKVRSNIQSENTTIQLEAVRAAGELDLKDQREPLLEMVDSGDLDEEVFYAAIWSLSQIGGQGVQAKFDEIMDSEIDDELAVFMENAIDNLAFNDGLADFDLFNIDEDGEEEEDDQQ
jgi:HEAT repeat protein